VELCLLYSYQCCGTGTVTAGTVTFFLGETETGMHVGSSSGTGFRSESIEKCNKKVNKSKMRGQISRK
jgi:hypothetical protein